MKTKTFYHLVLDRSGSMHSCWESTMNALQDEIQRVKSLRDKHPEQEIYLSVCVFNDSVSIPVKSSIQAEPEMSWLSLAQPNGSTALFDAIGDSMVYLEKTNPQWNILNDSMVVIILTDGHENASRRYPIISLKNRMEELKRTGKWTFAFIGADFDINQTAENFGIDESSRLNCNKKDMGKTFLEVNEMLDEMMMMKKMGLSKKGFFEKRKKQE